MLWCYHFIMLFMLLCYYVIMLLCHYDITILWYYLVIKLESEAGARGWNQKLEPDEKAARIRSQEPEAGARGWSQTRKRPGFAAKSQRQEPEAGARRQSGQDSPPRAMRSREWENELTEVPWMEKWIDGGPVKRLEPSAGATAPATFRTRACARARARARAGHIKKQYLTYKGQEQIVEQKKSWTKKTKNKKKTKKKKKRKTKTKIIIIIIKSHVMRSLKQDVILAN